MFKDMFLNENKPNEYSGYSQIKEFMKTKEGKSLDELHFAFLDMGKPKTYIDPVKDAFKEAGVRIKKQQKTSQYWSVLIVDAKDYKKLAPLFKKWEDDFYNNNSSSNSHNPVLLVPIQ